MSTPTADVADRGHTTIAERVVEKIAARAATDVEQAAGSSRRLLGISIGGVPATQPARVDVMVDGDVAFVHVELSVRWPSPVRDVSREVRAQITDQVTSLTGLTVAEVDIDVTGLPASTNPAPRRVV